MKTTESARPGARGVYNRIVKRGLDLFISVLALILLSPLILVAAEHALCPKTWNR